MSFILKHRVFFLWLFQIAVFSMVYLFSPSWVTTLIGSGIAGIFRANPWQWWKTPIAHILGLLLGGSSEHLWNVAEVVSSIVGLPNPTIYLIAVVLITTLVVSITAHSIWLWMPYRKEKNT